MHPVRVEVQHLELIVRAGHKKRFRRKAGRVDDGRPRLFHRDKICGMRLILENLFQAGDLRLGCARLERSRFFRASRSVIRGCIGQAVTYRC